MFQLDIDSELKLKIAELEDSNELFNLFDKNRKFLSAWLPNVLPDSSIIRTNEDYRNIIENDLKLFNENKSGLFLIIYKNKIAGTVVLQKIDWDTKSAGISYWIGEAYEGFGLVTKSVKRITEYAFNDLNLNKVYIQCAVNNIKSISIPLRLKFTQEEIDQQSLLLHGELVDVVKYSLLNSESKAKLAENIL